MNAFGSTILITGTASLLAERAVDERKRAALSVEPGADVNHITASELEDTMLSEVVGGSLFSSQIIAIIDDVGACPADVVSQLVEVAKHPGPDLCLVLVHGGGNKGKGLIDKLKKAKIETIKVEAPKPWELWKFVVAEARAHRLRMTQEAAEALVAAVGSDLRAIVASVAQLAGDNDRDEIDVPLIRRYFAGRAEVSSFSVADAVLAGNATLALERLRWAVDTGTAAVLITSAMASNFRSMGKYLDAQNRRMNDGELARHLGVPFFKIKDLRNYARRWNSDGVSSAIERIAQADADVKGAATDPDYALESMALDVLRCQYHGR